jgi:hypothetical protein
LAAGTDERATATEEAFADDSAAQLLEEAPPATPAPPAVGLAPTGPLVVSTGRVVESDALAVLVADLAPALGRIDDERAAAVARDAFDDALAGDGRAGDAVSAADLDAVAACLPVLSVGPGDDPAPLYAEIAVDPEGREVIVYAAARVGTAGDDDRVEVWMVERESCAVLATAR